VHRGPHRLERVGRQLLRHQADLGARGAEVGHDVVAVRDDLPGGGVDDAADDADERGLAGAVGPEQREDLAALDLDVQVPRLTRRASALEGNVSDGGATRLHVARPGGATETYLVIDDGAPDEPAPIKYAGSARHAKQLTQLAINLALGLPN
jgi:hypothetical protein